VQILLKHVWVAFIAVTCINAIVWWSRGEPHRIRDPQLTPGYQTLIKGFLIWGNIPWVVMAVGILYGGVPSAISFFSPREGNLFVMAFFASIFLVWIAGTYWLFLADGASKMVRYPGLLQPNISSPTILKLFWLTGVAAGVAATWMMYQGNVGGWGQP